MFSREVLELAMKMGNNVPAENKASDIIQALEWLLVWAIDRNGECKDLQVAEKILKSINEDVLNFPKDKCNWS